MSECSRYESLMCDCQADVTSWGIWGMFAAITDCHLVQSSDCQSLARPHSFPHQSQDHQGWLWLPLVISCRVIILHISHPWQLFLLVREDEKKALSLSSPTPGWDNHWHSLSWESLDGNVFRVWRHCARASHCLLSAPSYSPDFLKGWYNQMSGRYTNKILFWTRTKLFQQQSQPPQDN